MNSVNSILKEILFSQISKEAQGWIVEAVDSISRSQKSLSFYTLFSRASRYLSKEKITLTKFSSDHALEFPSLQFVSHWSILQTGRVLLLLSTPLKTEKISYKKILDELYETADGEEMLTLQKALPLYPFPEVHLERAGQGLRSSMDSVFLAIAHHNPYPALHFDEGTWNHMVLKTLFIGQSLSNITHLSKRNNINLKNMLLDYYQERKAALRSVNPQIWQCIFPFLEESEFHFLDRLIKEGSIEEKKAAFLCLNQQTPIQAKELVEKLRSQLELNYSSLTWESIYHEPI